MPSPQSLLASRIRAAREAAGLTQADLADELGIPRSAIVQIEAGNRKVSSLELERIAYLVGRDLTDFFKPSFNEEEALSVLFRASAPPKAAERLRECLTVARERRNLERLVGIERARRPGASYDLPVPGSRWDAITQGDLIAGEERQRLGLGRVPIADIADLIESQGIQAALIDFDDDISGLALHGDTIAPFIAVNRTHHFNRQRFSFAHEYAHVLLDHETRARISRQSERDDLHEMRANAFAGAFLLPEKGVRDAVAELGKGLPSRLSTAVFDGSDTADALLAESRSEPGSQDIQLYDVVQLAERFGVSPLAMIFRLKHLRIISEPEMQQLRSADDQRRMQELQVLLKLREEDGSPPVPPASPNPRFVGLALEVYRRDKITRVKLLELLRMAGVPAEDTDRLLATTGVDDDPPHEI